MTKEYTVSWSVLVEAESYEDAVKKVHGMRNDVRATTYTVADDEGTKLVHLRERIETICDRCSALLDAYTANRDHPDWGPLCAECNLEVHQESR